MKQILLSSSVPQPFNSSSWYNSSRIHDFLSGDILCTCKQTYIYIYTIYVLQITPEYLILALSLGTEVKSMKHLAHGHSIRGLFKALYRTTYEINTRFTGAPIQGAIAGRKPSPSEDKDLTSFS